MPSRRLSVIVAVIVVAAFLFVAIAPAFASGSVTAPAGLPLHARLLGSTPAAGQTVETASEVVLSFSEDVNPDFVEVVVEGPDGSVGDGEPTVNGRDVTQALVADLPAGAHTATYRVVSSDGHPVSGTVAFTTTAGGAASPSETPTATTAPPSPAPSQSATSSPDPAADASPAVEETSQTGAPAALWIALGAVALAVLATFVALAARGDRRGSEDGPA